MAVARVGRADRAGNVAEALKLIGSERYDVLLSDLHRPGAADVLTIISAMRHEG